MFKQAFYRLDHLNQYILLNKGGVERILYFHINKPIIRMYPKQWNKLWKKHYVKCKGKKLYPLSRK